MEKKIENLIKYCQGIYHKENGKDLYERYLKAIKSITPEELIIVQNEQLKVLSVEEMLTFVDKLMNVFHESLSGFKVEK